MADWSGLLVMVLATKHLYERGSAESKQPSRVRPSRTEELLREHSLSIFLLITGALWAALFWRMDPGKVGTSNWQHRLRMDADLGACAAHEALNRAGIKREQMTAAARAAMCSEP